MDGRQIRRIQIKKVEIIFAAHLILASALAGVGAVPGLSAAKVTWLALALVPANNQTEINLKGFSVTSDKISIEPHKGSFKFASNEAEQHTPLVDDQHICLRVGQSC